jgi:hypothetical protein
VFLRWLLLVTLVTGCPQKHDVPTCEQHAIGDDSQPIQLTPITIDQTGQALPVPDGGAVYLQAPPQGGYVSYAGVAATNLQACDVQVTGEFLDPSSGTPLSNLDGRSNDFINPRDGTYYPENNYSMIPNIPVCPDALGGHLVGKSATLRVDVTDANGKKARLDWPVIVSCLPNDYNCECSCGGDC